MASSISEVDGKPAENVSEGVLKGQPEHDARNPGTRQQAEKILKDQRDEAIKNLLTGEQKTRFEELKREKRGQDPPPSPPRENWPAPAGKSRATGL